MDHWDRQARASGVTMPITNLVQGHLRAYAFGPDSSVILARPGGDGRVYAEASLMWSLDIGRGVPLDLRGNFFLWRRRLPRGLDYVGPERRVHRQLVRGLPGAQIHASSGRVRRGTRPGQALGVGLGGAQWGNGRPKSPNPTWWTPVSTSSQTP